MQVKIDKQAIDKLLENLDQYSDSIKNAVADEIALTAYDIESMAKQRCPVKTGRLRASIMAFVDKDTMSAIVGTNVEYAAEVEYGSVKEHRKARPFLYPAYFKEMGKLFNNLKNILTNAKR